MAVVSLFSSIVVWVLPVFCFLQPNPVEDVQNGISGEFWHDWRYLV